MPSTINPDTIDVAKPEQGAATTQSVRDNEAATKANFVAAASDFNTLEITVGTNATNIGLNTAAVISAQDDIDTHVALTTGNPHGVTAVEVGAHPKFGSATADAVTRFLADGSIAEAGFLSANVARKNIANSFEANQTVAPAAGLASWRSVSTDNVAQLYAEGQAGGKLRLKDNSAAVDLKQQNIDVVGGSMFFRSYDDANVLVSTEMTIDRGAGVAVGAPTGGVPSTPGHLNAEALLVNGVAVGSGGGADVIILRDEKANNTNGGSASAGWQTRVLNVEVVDTGGNCTLSANQFTLDDGDYEVQAHAPGHKVGDQKLRIYNVTDTATAVVGANAQSSASDNTSTDALLNGFFTVTGGPKTYRLEHYCASASATFGLGRAVAVGAHGEVEVYSEVVLRKVS